MLIMSPSNESQELKMKWDDLLDFLVSELPAILVFLDPERWNFPFLTQSEDAQLRLEFFKNANDTIRF
jgi:hypothetical protein